MYNKNIMQSYFNMNKTFILIIILILVRLLLIIFFNGHGDNDNVLGYMENLLNGQNPNGINYSPFAYIFPYYYAYILNFFYIDFSSAVKILTVFSEIFLFFSIKKVFNIQLNARNIFLFFCNPLLIVFSSIHGQIDLLAISFAYYSFYYFFIAKERFFSSLLMSISFLIKPIFAPLLFFFCKWNNRINIVFFIYLCAFFSIPFFLTSNLFISLDNLYTLISVLLTRKSDHITTFIAIPYYLTNFIIFIFIFFLFFIEKKKVLVIILPLVLVIKSSAASHYLIWCLPMLFFNKRFGLITSIFLSINILLSYVREYYLENLFVNFNAFALNNNIFGQNLPSPLFSSDQFLILFNTFGTISFILIFVNVIFFLTKNEV